jgi:hypothetical protein
MLYNNSAMGFRGVEREISISDFMYLRFGPDTNQTIFGGNENSRIIIQHGDIPISKLWISF